MFIALVSRIFSITCPRDTTDWATGSFIPMRRETHTYFNRYDSQPNSSVEVIRSGVITFCRLCSPVELHFFNVGSLNVWNRHFYWFLCIFLNFHFIPNFHQWTGIHCSVRFTILSNSARFGNPQMKMKIPPSHRCLKKTGVRTQQHGDSFPTITSSD